MRNINQLSPSEFLRHVAGEMQALGNIATREPNYFSVTLKMLQQFADSVAKSESDGATVGEFLSSERAA